MKAFFDTSALVPAFLAAHPRHGRSMRWLRRVLAGEVRGALALHSAAEAWAVLSAFPGAGRPDPGGLRRAVAFLLDGPFEVVAPTRAGHRKVLLDLAERGIPGGAVHDALHLEAARRCGADVVLTNDVRGLRRLAPDLAGRIRAP